MAHIRNILFDVGVDSLKPEDIYPYIGKPLAETFSRLLPPHLHGRIPEAAITYRDYYRAHAFDTTNLFPGVRETIAALHAMGINLATATIKSTETTARVLAHYGIAQYFSHIQGTDDGVFKPDPSIINGILARQNWERNETLMVGDTDKDVEVGRNAGVRTCGVTYGSFTREQMIALNPDWVIDRIERLLDIVQGQDNRSVGSVSQN
jgi:phosphoglycolate phosphatase